MPLERAEVGISRRVCDAKADLSRQMRRKDRAARERTVREAEAVRLLNRRTLVSRFAYVFGADFGSLTEAQYKVCEAVLDDYRRHAANGDV